MDTAKRRPKINDDFSIHSGGDNDDASQLTPSSFIVFPALLICDFASLLLCLQFQPLHIESE